MEGKEGEEGEEGKEGEVRNKCWSRKDYRWNVGIDGVCCASIWTLRVLLELQIEYCQQQGKTAGRQDSETVAWSLIKQLFVFVAAGEEQKKGSGAAACSVLLVLVWL